MNYYQIIPGQVSQSWLSVQPYTIGYDGVPVLDNKFITIKPNDIIPKNVCVSEGWKKDIEKLNLNIKPLH